MSAATHARAALGCLVSAWVALMPGAALSDPAGPPLLIDRVDPSGPGEPAPPSSHAVALRGAMVPDVLGARLTFVDVSLDAAFTDWALRFALQGGWADIADQERNFEFVGNARLEYWFGLTRAGAYRTAAAVGASLPLGSLLDADAVFYEQRPQVSVPGAALWYRQAWIWSGAAWSAMIDGLLGLDLSAETDSLMASLTATVNVEIHRLLVGSLALVVPELARFNPTLLVGLRSRPVRAFEVSAGVHFVPRALLYDEALSPIRPVVELRGRF